MSTRARAAGTSPVTATAQPSKWIFRLRPCEVGTPRLFCIPPVGKGATIFNGWARALHPDLEVNAVRPPGRENRMGERPISDLRELVGALSEQLLSQISAPYALFGHCTGAQLAFELCRHLRSQGTPLPLRLLVANRLAPQLAAGHQPIHCLPLDELTSQLRRMGADTAFLEDRELMEFMEPTLRADFALYDGYEYTEQVPLPIPISVFGDRDNANVHITDLRAWQRQTVADFTVQMISFDAVSGVPLPPSDTVLSLFSKK